MKGELILCMVMDTLNMDMDMETEVAAIGYGL